MVSKYSQSFERKKKQDEVPKSDGKADRVMVDKCIQTDEKLYQDWLRNQQLEKARNIIQNSILMQQKSISSKQIPIIRKRACALRA